MKDMFVIRGGNPLKGTVSVRGSKNAASKMMVASLLTDEPCTLENVPLSAEIDITRELCEIIGSIVESPGDHRVVLRTPYVRTSLVTHLSRKNRIPILAVGPLLYRRGFAEIPVLGGCPIGHRPINFHIDALTKMGVVIERREHSYFAKAERIFGADISLGYPSVGATENILLTATLAKGSTTIRNAAVEPEILNVIEMLRAMGADIAVNGRERLITIHGVSKLHGVTARVIPDRNEVVSFACAAFATGGDLSIPDVEESHLAAFLAGARAIGATWEFSGGHLRFFGNKPYRAIAIETAPHPGFMTDWQQPFAVVLTQAEGTSILHETVYEDRFGYTKDLKRMGADIEVTDECLSDTACRFKGKGFHHSARITGPTALKGADIAITDLRAGIAHIIAALAARGESRISGLEHIDRGYERIEERLREVGADMERVKSK